MTEQSEEQDPNTLSLEAREYGKIGTIHCGVTRDGMISIGGRQYEVEDGAKVGDEITRHHRNAGRGAVLVRPRLNRGPILTDPGPRSVSRCPRG